MINNNMNKLNNKMLFCLELFVLGLVFCGVGFGAYPDFSFSTGSYSAGEVDVVASSSSGTRVDLYINSQFVGQQDVYSDVVDVLLDGSNIDSVIVPIGATLRFTNDDLTRIYRINISSIGEYSVLNFGDVMLVSFDSEQSVSYSDEESGDSAIINVVDEFVNFNFTSVSSYMVDGNNEFLFEQRSGLPSFGIFSSFTFSVSYDKFPNSITVDNFVNETMETSVDISGRVLNSAYPLYYVVNIEPSGLSNFGALNSVDMDIGRFNVTVSGLKEGINDIYFVSVDGANTNVFTGMEKVSVLVDTFAPSFDIVSATFGSGYSVDVSNDIYVNENSLTLEIVSDDAFVMNYSYNGVDKQVEFVGGNVTIDLSLRSGQNNLTLIAVDSVGNFFKEAHNIFYDGEKPRIEKLGPESLFDQGTAHFFFQDIDGRLNKGNVEVTIFTIAYGAKTIDGNIVTCDNYNDMFVRNLGQLDRDRVDSVELNLEEQQISLTNFMFQKTTVTADSEGNFDALIGLQEKDFTTSDYNAANKDSNKISNVESRNLICFVMVDKYGNIGIEGKNVELDSGNTMWKSEEITTIPNTLYSSEVEQTGDVRSGNGYVEFGMIARLSYIGSGEVNKISRFSIRKDSKVTSNAKFKIDTSRMNYRLDKDSGEMIIYVPVQILPQDIDPLEYPDSLEFYFAADIGYTVGDKNIPIDTVNPIYFTTKVNIERPLDHAKWLTPKMIEDTQKFLNQTIKYTEMAVKYTGYASIGGVVACTGYKFYATWKKAATCNGDNVDKQKCIDDIDRDLYMICDRVACTSSPDSCEFRSSNVDDNGMLSVPRGINTKNGKSKTLNGADLGAQLDFIDDKTKLVAGELKDIRFVGDCKTSQGKPGVKVSGTLLTYKDQVSPITGNIATIDKTQSVRNNCVEATGERVCTDKDNCLDKKKKKCKDGSDKPCYTGCEVGSADCSVNSFNIRDVGSTCFDKEAPKFDDTRCNFFGIANEKGVPGEDPSSSIISSIKCGCITDTYSHLKNYLVIMNGIYMCLEQAKIGDIKGSYCERLMGQAVCDIATSVVLPEIEKRLKPGRTTGSGDSDTRNDQNFLQAMKKTNSAMNDRYAGTFFDKAGLSTDKIVNKACVAAITGDWSILTDNILSAIDQNEVEPIFGPPFPESRQQGYNPITGKLSIRYMFTHAGVSGGQRVEISYEFICDKSQSGGEYCPSSGVVIGSSVPGSELNIKKLVINKGSSVQDTVVVVDPSAKYWYNILRVTYKYKVKDKSEEYSKDFKIIHKDEALIASCYWSVGVVPTDVASSSGEFIQCDSIFSEDSLVSVYKIDEKKTKLLPSKQGQTTYYSGNTVFVDLAYDISSQDTSQTSFSLSYMAVCKDIEGKDVKLGKGPGVTPPFEEVIRSLIPGVGGRAIIPTYTIPEIGEQNIGLVIFETDKSISLQKEHFYLLKFTNLNAIKSSEIRISKIFVENENGVVEVLRVPTSFITQNINVNNNNAQNSAEFLKLLVDEDVSGKLIVEFSNKDLKDVVVSLLEKVDDTDGDPILISNLFKANSEVSDGLCTLKMRILPTDQANALTAANFDSYSPIYGNSEEESNVIVDDNLEKSVNDIITKTFNLKSKATSNTEYFELVSPINDGYICLKSDGNKVLDSQDLDLAYLFQSTLNKPINGMTISYSLTAGQYGEIASSGDSNDEIKITKSGLCKVSDTSFYLDKNIKFKEYLATMVSSGSEEIGDKASSWILGSSSPLEGVLSYTVKIEASQDNGYTSDKEEKKSINVKFVVSDNCQEVKEKCGEGNVPGQ